MNSNFTSINSIPIKVFVNNELCEHIKSHDIPPFHVQLMPTNKCNLHCKFCSCENRDRGQELDWDKLQGTIKKLHELGTKAITISGGGEPLLYPKINELIDLIDGMGIQLGLVTNGVSFGYLTFDSLRKFTWCRISSSDEAKLDLYGLSYIVESVRQFNVDFAFSYVMTDSLNTDYIKRIITFANNYNFSHVRFINDTKKPRDDSEKSKVQSIKELGVDLSKVIFQNSEKFCKGTTNCYLSLLKPVIAADGNMYPCCRIQYMDGDKFDISKSMGNDLDEIYSKQKMFDGSVCGKCYFGEYNGGLGMLWNSDKIKHQEHV